MLQSRRGWISRPLPLLLAAACGSLVAAGCDSELPAAHDQTTRPPLPDGVDQLDLVGDSAQEEDAQDLLDDTADATDSDVANAPPVITSLTAAPLTVAPGTSVTLVLNAHDPDGDVLTITWRVEGNLGWTLDPPAAQGLSTTLRTTELAGEQATVVVEVRDPHNGLAEASVVVTTEGDDVCEPGTSHCEPDGACRPFNGGSTSLCAAPSCLALRVRDENAPSGEYWVRLSPSDTARQVHCDMTYAGGGWTRIADLDRTRDASCPGDWSAATATGGLAVCTRGSSESTLTRSAEFRSGGLAWAEVRGYAEAAQKGTTDGFQREGTPAPELSLDEPYADGLSITLGSPRQHLWTYALSQGYTNTARHSCPCRGGMATPAPDFVGAHYACDAASPNVGAWDTWHTDSPVWHGNSVNNGECDVRGAPSWFVRHLAEPTTAPLEVRILGDESVSNEDVGVTRLVLEVREAERCNDVDDDYDGQIDEPGCGPENPATSCNAILEAGGFAASGLYWLQPQADRPALEVYCDMEWAGGGWALAAVCRPHDSTGCADPNAVGTTPNPLIAQSAKLSDDDIRALMVKGESLAQWRTDTPAAASYVVLNTYDDPSQWKSEPCSTPEGATFKVKSALIPSLEPVWDELLEQATANPEATITVAPGDCGCTASGWSNFGADNCTAPHGWGAKCEGGPSTTELCDTEVRRSEVVLWVR